jgi:hypothetical protein
VADQLKTDPLTGETSRASMLKEEQEYKEKMHSFDNHLDRSSNVLLSKIRRT